MTEEQKRVIGHDISELAKGWNNLIAGSIGAATPAQHLKALAGLTTELGYYIKAAIEAVEGGGQ